MTKRWNAAVLVAPAGRKFQYCLSEFMNNIGLIPGELLLVNVNGNVADVVIFAEANKYRGVIAIDG